MASIRPMTVEEIPQVERLMETAAEAWRKQIGARAPECVGSRLVKSRFHKEPTGCFIAEEPAQRLLGAVLSITWGSVAWLGPLAVHPDAEAQGLEVQLISTVLDYWEPMTLLAQGVEVSPESPTEVELYASFGFRPQFPTGIFVGAVDPAGPRAPVRQRTPQFELIRLSQLTEALEETMLGHCRRIADRHYPGLDYQKELQSVKEHALGDTLLLAVGERLYGFAICHTSDASEAEPRECYVKALLIDPAIDDQETLLALLEACEGYARMQKLDSMRIGLNLAGWEGYRAIAERGYEMRRLRLRMVRPVGELLSDPSPFHFNDWR